MAVKRYLNVFGSPLRLQVSPRDYVEFGEGIVLVDEKIAKKYKRFFSELSEIAPILAQDEQTPTEPEVAPEPVVEPPVDEIPEPEPEVESVVESEPIAPEPEVESVVESEPIAPEPQDDIAPEPEVEPEVEPVKETKPKGKKGKKKAE